MFLFLFTHTVKPNCRSLITAKSLSEALFELKKLYPEEATGMFTYAYINRIQDYVVDIVPLSKELKLRPIASPVNGHCPNCGVVVFNSNNFCPNCGVRLI